ncbi:hypothetical protein MTO96_038332 [Rhipicephalus appendiculatus]
MSEELQRVGAVASHVATRLTNPFDSDRAGRVTPVTECTPAVAALLTPTQPQQSMEADAADMDNIDSWQWDLEPAEPEEARPSQSNTSTQCAADEPSRAQLPTSAVATQPDPVATGTVSHEKPAGTSRTSCSMKQAVKSELDARLSNLATEARQKKREHLLRMRLMRDELKKRDAVHALEVENLRARKVLLELEITLMRKKNLFDASL